MINYKRLLTAILIGSLLIFGVRRYTLNWAMYSMDLGCREAALKEYLYFNVVDGNRLNKFCDARQKAIADAFRW